MEHKGHGKVEARMLGKTLNAMSPLHSSGGQLLLGFHQDSRMLQCS